MKKIVYFPLIMLAALFVGCSQSDQKTQQLQDDSYESTTETKSSGAIVFSTDDDASEEIVYAMTVVRDNYNQMTRFADEPQVVDNTDVPNRYNVHGRFIMPNRGVEETHYYSVYVQKFGDKWEYGTLLIGDSPNLTLNTADFVANGKMKEKEASDGVGDHIVAGGVDFVIAEKKPTAIRVYTNNKLSRQQLKSAIIDLSKQYETLQFATATKHERGDEYASWTGGMFFDYDKNEIIGGNKFLK